MVQVSRAQSVERLGGAVGSRVKVSGEGQLPELPPWVELLRSWNESLPAGHECRYKHRGNFRQDFLKAFDQVVDYYR
jgi:hypothetical protein